MYNSPLVTPLANDGFAVIEPLHSQAQISQWNQLFSPIFANQQAGRRYVDGADMCRLGLFEQLFNPALQQLIYQIQADAVLYHCHAYEIDGQQDTPHILADNFCDGWHRDWDCPVDLRNPNAQQISLFIYLTDVEPGHGGFEVCDKKLGYLPRQLASSRFYQLLGPSGYTFLFNRVAYHRASPNLSSVPRRVIKISFQSSKDFNSRLALPQFEYLRQHLAQNIDQSQPNVQPFLRQLIGDKTINRGQVSQYMADLNLANLTKPITLMPPPAPIKVNINWLHEYRATVRDLKFVFNLSRKVYHQGY